MVRPTARVLSFYQNQKRRGESFSKYNGHKLEIDCWCLPEVEYEGYSRIIIHNDKIGKGKE